MLGFEENDSFTNYYEVLEVAPQATPHEIYQGYLKIKKAYSLRNLEIFKSFSFEEIQQLLILVEEAYATIGNKETREIYDARFFQLYPHLKTSLSHLDFKDDDKKPVERPTSDLPSGFAKTPMSVYELDEAFESLIAGQDYYDGVFLGKIRKYKKVKLEDFSQQTCISIRHLYAIEDNNYTALPAQVFVRGYINQYCKILGLDADKVISSFMKLYTNGRQ